MGRGPAHLRVLCPEVQGFQEKGGQLRLVRQELFLLHHPDVLLQDAHEWAHVVLPCTQQRECLLCLRAQRLLTEGGVLCSQTEP